MRLRWGGCESTFHLLLEVVEIGVPKFDQEQGLLLTLARYLSDDLEKSQIKQLFFARIVSLLWWRQPSLIFKEPDRRLLRLLCNVVDLVKQFLDFSLLF